MSSANCGEQRLPSYRYAFARLSRRLAITALMLAGAGAFATTAGAEETPAGFVSFPGTPLTVTVGPEGQCQSSYPSSGNNYFTFIPNLGDCGFFLAFPKAGSGQPTALKDTTWGFDGSAGPNLSSDNEGGNDFIPVSQSPVTGAGTSGSPYTETTVFKVSHEASEYALITETTTYVSGEPQFTSTYNVKNVGSSTLYFRAMYAGDLFVNGNDKGTGVFLAGPPSFIGGQNAESGVLGGFVEAAAPAPPWSSYEEGFWNSQADPRDYEGPYSEGDNGIWNAVRTTAEMPQAFNDRVESLLLDNAAGVEWDQLRTTGLAENAEQAFTIINRTQVPNGLQVVPPTQTQVQGHTATVTVTGVDTGNSPYVGKSLRYTISGANPSSGSVTTNAAGQAQITYVGANPGIDTIQMYLDLGNSSVQSAADPAGTATVTFTPAPPIPNSTYTVQSIKGNPDGTVTITFVPTQAGTAAVVVTVPTGTIARNQTAIAAKAKKAKKCKAGQTKIKGKCRPTLTVTGTTKATGSAGVPLTLSVKPSSKIKSLLKKGKTVHLTATLTYTAALGGTPTTHAYKVTLKGKKPKHGKKGHK